MTEAPRMISSRKRRAQTKGRVRSNSTDEQIEKAQKFKRRVLILLLPFCGLSLFLHVINAADDLIHSGLMRPMPCRNALRATLYITNKATPSRGRVGAAKIATGDLTNPQH